MPYVESLEAAGSAPYVAGSFVPLPSSWLVSSLRASPENPVLRKRGRRGARRRVPRWCCRVL